MRYAMQQSVQSACRHAARIQRSDSSVGSNAQGWNVRGTVRSMKDPTKYSTLNALAAALPGAHVI